MVISHRLPDYLYLYLGWVRSKRFLMKKEPIMAKPRDNVANFKKTILTDIDDFEEYWYVVNPPHKCKVQFKIDTNYLSYDKFITNFTFNTKIYRKKIYQRFWSNGIYFGNVMKKIEYTNHIVYNGEIPSDAIISHKRYNTDKSLYHGYKCD